MVAYFKPQTRLFMAVGALLGALAAALSYADWLSPKPVFLRGFLMVTPIFIGVILGRIAAARWAAVRLGRITALLYRDGDPAAFLAAFEPLAERVSADHVEYYDARTKLAYAHEALGQFDRGLERLSGLDPSSLKLHSLGAEAAVCNQRTRLALLREDTEQAEAFMAQLRSLKTTASGRAPALADQLGNCLDLYRVWLQVIRGEDADRSYLREEIDLSKNRIHKSEMQLLLARAEYAAGDPETARTLLLEAADTGRGLYAGEKAEELLSRQH